MHPAQSADLTDRLARLLTALACSYLCVRVGMGLYTSLSGDPALAAAW